MTPIGEGKKDSERETVQFFYSNDVGEFNWAEVSVVGEGTSKDKYDQSINPDADCTATSMTINGIPMHT